MTKEDYNNKIIQLEAKNRELSIGSSGYLKQIDSFKDIVKNRDEQISILKANKETLVKDIDSFKSSEEKLKQNLEVCNKENFELKIEIERKDKENQELNKQILSKHIENSELQNENNKLTIDKEDLQNRLSIFANLDVLNNLYKEVSKNKEIKEKCQPFFGKNEAIDKILVNIAKQRSIEGLWQYICDSINKESLKENEIENLKKIFEISFGYLQAGDSNFEILDTAVSKPFENSTMQKYKSTGIGTKVKKIFLFGFKHKAANRIVKQSLVSVE